MRFDVKTHHICGKSARKTTQKHTTWWQKIKTWHTIPLLVPTKQSRKLTFTKMARHSATCANQFVKMIAKKHTTWWQKNKIASVFAPPFVAPSKRPLRNYTKCTQRTILQKWKGTIDERANQWYNSYINEVNHV